MRLIFPIMRGIFLCAAFTVVFVAPQYSYAAFTDGQNASDLLGQYVANDGVTPDYTKSAPNSSGLGVFGLNLTTAGSVMPSIAIDTVNHRLFLSDTSNNRVLVFNLNTSDVLLDRTPDFVLGKPNFTSGSQPATPTQSNIKEPSGIAVDSAGQRLFVADAFSRVMVYDITTITNGENAINVLGQVNFTSNAIASTQSGMDTPKGLAYDPSTNQLYVAMQGNHSVRVYDVASITNGENATHVLGQIAFNSTFAGDGAASMRNPSAIAIDTTRQLLFVAEGFGIAGLTGNRVKVFDVSTITDGEAAVNILGQPDFTDRTARNTQNGLNLPDGLAYDATNQRLFVAESAGNRVKIFDLSTITDYENAVNVLGQSLFTTATAATTQNGMRAPTGVAYIPAMDSLYIADSGNNRVWALVAAASAGFTVSKATTTVAENAGTSTFTVVLTSAPASNVVFSVTSSATGEGTVAPATLTFTTGNWNMPQVVTITGVNDNVFTTDVATMTVSVIDASSDDNWDPLADQTVVATFTNDDVPGFSVTPSAPDVSITEAATNTSAYSVVLTAQPTSNVVINVTATSSALLINTPALTFTPANWNIPQSVSISATKDANTISEQNQTVTFNVNDPLSDNNWDPLPDQFRNVDVVDTDVAGFTITVPDNITGEDVATGGNGSFTIVMTSQPTANVTVALSSSNTAEGTVQPSVTFTPANWNVPQTITVTGVDDFVQDGAIAYTIVTGAVTSVDVTYGALNGTAIPDISMVNQDNEAPGIIVTLVGTTTTEGGGTAHIQFTLLSQPAGGADVTIPLSSSNAAEGTIPASITILNANWNTPAANDVVVTGVDDAIVDGNILYTIVTGDPTSADAAYNSLTAANVADPTISNLDDDVLPPAPGIPDMTSATDDGSSNTDNSTTDTTPDFTMSCITGNTVTLFAGAAAIGSGTCVAGTVTITSSTLSVSSYSITAKQTDAFGNVSLASAALPITIVAVTPLVTSGGGGVVGVTTGVTPNYGTQSIGTCADTKATNYGVPAPCIYPTQSNYGAAATSQSSSGGEPNVPPEFQPYVCDRYIRSYILPDASNNANDVVRLQQFLNDSQGEHLETDGLYKSVDIAAVKRFQAKYLTQIIKPWGHSTPTGNVYKTTVAKINLMVCAKKRSCPYFKEYLKQGDVSLESVRVQDFLNIVFAPTTGYPTTGIPLSKNFDSQTVKVLKDYQNVYRLSVLTPWGLKKPSGWFYQTTRYSANDLVGCNEGSVKLDTGQLYKGEYAQPSPAVAASDQSPALPKAGSASTAGIDLKTCPVFSSRHDFGSSGPEVQKIQSFLDKELGLNLQTNGYFGDGTRAGVITFQEKYFNDILAPGGFTKGTGMWFPATYKKANEILGCN